MEASTAYSEWSFRRGNYFELVIERGSVFQRLWDVVPGEFE